MVLFFTETSVVPCWNAVSSPGVPGLLPGDASEPWVPPVCLLQENPQTSMFKISNNADKPNSFSFWFIYSFIHMCIHCLGHLSPLPPTPTLST
jgi:hypothetical protein